MRLNLFFCILLAASLSSCVKEAPSETAVVGGCDALNSIQQITGTTAVRIGEPINVWVPEIEGYRIFSWIGPNNFTSQYASNDVTGYAELKHEGWYYVHVSNPECDNAPTDSIYVDVQLNQGTPPCTTVHNSVSYNNVSIPGYTYTSVDRGISPSFDVLELSAGNSGSDLNILFHPYWNNREPEDGIYETINTSVFDPVDGNYNKMYIRTVNQSILWSCWENQQVFVSHVNGKLRVQYCDLAMGGYNGTSYTTYATGELTED